MSTMFEVYPRETALPTFGTIIQRSTTELHRFLDSIGIPSRPLVHMTLQACKDHAHLPFSLEDQAMWDKDNTHGSSWVPCRAAQTPTLGTMQAEFGSIGRAS